MAGFDVIMVVVKPYIANNKGEGIGMHGIGRMMEGMRAKIIRMDETKEEGNNGNEEEGDTSHDATNMTMNCQNVIDNKKLA